MLSTRVVSSTFLPSNHPKGKLLFQEQVKYMRRPKSEKITIEPELIVQSNDNGIVLTPAILETYTALLRKQGRREDSIRGLEKTLMQFYDALPPDKVIQRNVLAQWRKKLLDDGYAIRTVNSKVSTINSLLESMDCREYQVSGQLDPEQYLSPELTRQEYIRMLQTAKALEDERSYTLVKLFATTGIGVIDLPLVTVEAVRDGSILVQKGKKAELLRLPDCLRADLLRYANTIGCGNGIIFTKKNGEPLARTQVSAYIQKLVKDAKISPEKGIIRCLRQLYQTTIAGIAANFDLLVQQAYSRQLEMEQLSAGWENR